MFDHHPERWIPPMIIPDDQTG